MNWDTLNTRTDEAIIEFPQDDLEINAVIQCPVIHCAPTPPVAKNFMYIDYVDVSA